MCLVSSPCNEKQFLPLLPLCDAGVVAGLLHVPLAGPEDHPLAGAPHVQGVGHQAGGRGGGLTRRENIRLDCQGEITFLDRDREPGREGAGGGGSSWYEYRGYDMIIVCYDKCMTYKLI